MAGRNRPGAAATKTVKFPASSLERSARLAFQDERLNAGKAHSLCSSRCCGVESGARVSRAVRNQPGYLGYGELIGLAGHRAPDDGRPMADPVIVVAADREAVSLHWLVVPVQRGDKSVCLCQRQRPDVQGTLRRQDDAQ